MGNLNLNRNFTMAQAQGGALAILERVRNQIKARGAKTIRGLGRTFRNFDSFDGNHKIDAEEFYSGLCEIQIRVTRAEANALMGLFDTDGDGHVNFDEFLVGIRGSLNAKRQAMVDKAFLKFDANGDGEIQRDEWNEYYAAVSSSIDNDDHFVQLMK